MGVALGGVGQAWAVAVRRDAANDAVAGPNPPAAIETGGRGDAVMLSYVNRALLDRRPHPPRVAIGDRRAHVTRRSIAFHYIGAWEQPLGDMLTSNSGGRCNPIRGEPFRAFGRPPSPHTSTDGARPLLPIAASWIFGSC